MSLDSDPEIAAAFGGGPAPATAAPISDDPEIHAAFSEKFDGRNASDTTLLRDPKTGEITDGPIGFINGVAGLAGKGILNIPYAAASGVQDLYRMATGGDAKTPDSGVVDALHFPLSENEKNVAESVSGTNAGKVVSNVKKAATQVVNEDLPIPEPAKRVVKDVAAIAPLGFTTAGAAERIFGEAPAVIPKPSISVNAQGVVQKVAERQSGGAAGTAANVADASLPLQSRIAEADPAKIDKVAMDNHIEADKHGVQLTKGQANRDPVQYSKEQNSTHPTLVNTIGAQNGQLTDAIDNIRRDASPTHVGNDAIENGQTVVDALKAHDEPIQADIRAKYQALTDANGGNLPIDTGSFLKNVDAQLKKNYLTGSVPKGAQEMMDSLRTGEPLDFEGFEAARSRLAEAQRAGGSEGAAAKIIRGQLEQMPLSPEAAKLKGLADQARSAAKSRFDALDADPAYQAAVDDVSSGVKKGEPSPLADRFLDKYVLGTAPKANVDRLMSKLDEDSKGAVSSHTLNAVRKAAVNPNGNVLPNGYNGALQKIGPKLDSLVSPETQDSLESLGRVITNAKVAPAGNFVNYSKSGVISNAAHGVGEAALGHVPGIKHALPIVKGMVESNFARDATAPGAGIER
jgi:hypothetical protein